MMDQETKEDRIEQLEARNAELERLLHAAEDRATRCEIEAQDMYETANSQLQKSLELAQERIAQLERENGTLGLSLAVLHAKDEGGDLLRPTEEFLKRKPPISPLKKGPSSAAIQGE